MPGLACLSSLKCLTITESETYEKTHATDAPVLVRNLVSVHNPFSKATTHLNEKAFNHAF